MDIEFLNLLKSPLRRRLRKNKKWGGGVRTKVEMRKIEGMNQFGL
jgi:hypothetical protein